MKLDYCQKHRGAPVEDAALPCLAIRHDDGRRVTQRELWAEIERLRAELERERMRLAACGVVANADTPESAAKARDMHPDYRSDSLEAVERRVDECMRLRAELADARNLLCKLRSPHPRLRVEYWTGQWWVPLQGNALDATLAALEPAPKWSVAIGA